MSILVVCPGCRKSFKVGDQHAGKSGPCPKCKTIIKVPKKSEEVIIHAPTAFVSGGRSISGELITKPIARTDTKLNPVVAVAIGSGVATVLLVTWAAGGLIQRSLAVRLVGLLLVSPPLVVAAYSFLRNDELEPYRGVSLYLRTGICCLAYVALWGVFGYVAAHGVLGDQLWTWLFVAPPFLITGSLIALACFDLEFGNGFFHYAFYVLVTMLLRWAAGMGWAWDAANTPLG
jgi:hypothetical protein